MSEPETMNKIRTGVPGMYRVTRSEFESYADFDHAMREAEGIARRRMAFFKPHKNFENEEQFDFFLIEIVAPPRRQ